MYVYIYTVSVHCVEFDKSTYMGGSLASFRGNEIDG